MVQVKPVKANLMKNRFITTAAILLFMMPAVVSCSDNDEPDKPDVPDTSIQGEPRSITKEEFKEKVMGKVWVNKSGLFDNSGWVKGDGTIAKEFVWQISGGVNEDGFSFDEDNFYLYFWSSSPSAGNCYFYNEERYFFDEATGRANYTDPNKLSPWSFYTKPGNSIFYIESVSDDILVLHNIYAWETDEYYENRSLHPEQSYYRAYYRALPEAEADKWLSQYSKWPEN